MATLLVCQGAVASPPGRPGCGPAHAPTLARDRDVRVYQARGGAPSALTGTYACLPDRPRAAPLTLVASGPGSGRGISVGRVALAGTVVAYARSTHGVDAGRTDIMVADVARRRTLRTILGAGGVVDACVIRFRDVIGLAVTRRGGVVWMVREGARCRTTALAVYRAGGSGAPVLLERGPGVVPGSLRRSGDVARWRDAAGWRSVPLPPA